jgi:hypothetical protein
MAHDRRFAAADSGTPAPFVLVVSGPDGEPLLERFDDATAYQARLVTLGSADQLPAVTIDEIAGWLDE